ncbi:hypothetical protein S-CBP42_0030 [Synechococcus phage S-CBP42]|nr:hypothetical protein AVU76_gp30 [Synechococcus phage S-CBP42]AGK86681.1 hypothetical protein S-CBP42_0030 [Synechococcus phage S-CBP42]
MMKPKTRTVYEIYYSNPRFEGEKQVLWRGKDATNASRSWLGIAGEGTEIVSVRPVQLTWQG